MEEFKNLLSSFSMLGYLKRNKSFSEKDLLKYIKNAIKIEGYETDTYKVKKDIVENLCILMQDGLEYVFSHRTFQEFFTAQYICFTEIKEGNKYISVLSFIYNEYKQIYPLEIDNKQSERMVETIKILGECIVKDEEWELSIDELNDEEKQYFIRNGIEAL